MVKAFAGMLADSHGPKDVTTGKAVAAAIAIGRLVVVDSANGDGAVKVPAATGDVTNLARGVAMHSHSLESSSSGSPTWPIKSAVPVLLKGRVYVTAEDAVADGAAVFVRHTGANAGQFRSDVDGGNATLLPGAKYRSSTTGAGLAVVELNMP
jgi:hypothetical protein